MIDRFSKEKVMIDVRFFFCSFMHRFQEPLKTIGEIIPGNAFQCRKEMETSINFAIYY